MHDKIEHAIHELTHELRAGRELRISELELARSHSCLATKNDLHEMEKRLTHAIAKNASLPPSIESAALSVQFALDKLDAAIPDNPKSP